MRAHEILNEEREKPANIYWPGENYDAWLAKIPWPFEIKSGKKPRVVKTTTEKMEKAYNIYIEGGSKWLTNPLSFLLTDLHYDTKFRNRFNKLLVSEEGGLILPTGDFKGYVLSYLGPEHAKELAKEVIEKQRAALDKDQKQRDAQHRKRLDKEKARKASEEKRIPTGVRNTTVIDPSSFDKITARRWKDLETYSGSPSGIHLGNVQERNYDALSDALQRNGKKFNYVGYASYTGAPAYNTRTGNAPTLTRFVMTAPGFVWEKYEGDTAGGGQNRVYVAGQAMKLTSFLALSPKKQDALIQSK